MSGLLGKAALVADTDTEIYTVPANTVTTLSVLIVNRGTDSAKFRVAITDAVSPAAADYIEYDATIPVAGGVFERTGLVCSAGEQVFVRSSTANCSVRVNGFEQGV
ncbi:hypothetical protein [Marinomonas atlantica]|uniref:hypothetical protein n=1 Tax=Marinomonas atlantica TaxID=1806668 RepID=UPI00082A42BC|nr:hypothetical protein [Marinomonas atlantica]